MTLLVFGLLFTFGSLAVISGTTKKKEQEESVAVAVNSALLETDEDQPVADIENNGKKKTAEDLHVYPITTATILF
jgi:hypothetical protein